MDTDGKDPLTTMHCLNGVALAIVHFPPGEARETEQLLAEALKLSRRFDPAPERLTIQCGAKERIFYPRS